MPDANAAIVVAHPEHGDFTVRPAGPPVDGFQELYYDMLKRLVERKWEILFGGRPYPVICRAEFLTERDLEPDCPFAPVQGVLLSLPENPWNKRLMRPGRLEASLAKNRCSCFKLPDGRVAVSPFFEWELAEFWEGECYQHD